MLKFPIRNPRNKYTLGIMLLLLIATLISIRWLDLPLYSFIEQNSLYNNLGFSEIEDAIPWIDTEYALFTFAAFVLFLQIYCFDPHNKKIFVIYMVVWVAATMAFATSLKFVFARCIPELWYNNLCPVKSTSSTFFWFDAHFGSFPSGHSSVLGFCILWLVYAKRSFYILGILILVLLIFGMVVAGYHYLGDCFAGLAIGLGLGMISYNMWCKFENISVGNKGET